MKLRIPLIKGNRPPARGVVKPPGLSRGFAAGWGMVPGKDTAEGVRLTI
jgi:hypothetical protein